MKNLILILVSTALISCADQTKRQKNLEALYPKCKVEPATGMIQAQGYEFIIIDTNTQIVAVSFYPFSETKLNSLRNIR